KKIKPIAETEIKSGNKNQKVRKIRQTSASMKKIAAYTINKHFCSLIAPINPTHGMANSIAKASVVVIQAYFGPEDEPTPEAALFSEFAILKLSPRKFSSSISFILIFLSRNSEK